MVTAGIFPFKENSYGRAGNRTRNLTISSQKLWPLDHEAGRMEIYLVFTKCMGEYVNKLWAQIRVFKLLRPTKATFLVELC